MRLDTHPKCSWQVHQQTQIDSFNKTELKLQPVFPGSMLFNQIAVPTKSARSLFEIPMCTPESVNVVYQYCGDVHTDNELSNSILIDSGDYDSVESVTGIVKLLESDAEIDQLIFLGHSARDVLFPLLKDRLKKELIVTVVEPDWSSIYSQYLLFRQARHVIFFDSMRVLDAVFMRCNCSLVATSSFRSCATFNVLLHHLQELACPVYDQTGSLLSRLSGDVELPFMIAENQRSNLMRALEAAKYDDGRRTDWLDDLLNVDNTPVIDRRRDALHSPVERMRDRKTRFSRKLAKLRNDPLAFLADSNFRILRCLAHAATSRTG